MTSAFLLLLVLICISNRSDGSLNNESISLLSRRKWKCRLQDKTSGEVPGPARNVNVECKFNEASRHFYYQFSWQHPEPTVTPVSSYQIRFMPTLSRQWCYNILSEETTFALPVSGEFFQPYHNINYAVITKPIKRIGGTFRKELKTCTVCPLPPELDKLSDMAIWSGDNWSFECKFKQRSNPEATMKWYFSQDKINCSGESELNNTKHIGFSTDKCSLYIWQATVEHNGCYILKAYIGDGHESRARGYLTVKEEKNSDLLFTEDFRMAWGIAVGVLVVGVVFAVAISLNYILRKISKKHKPNPIDIHYPLNKGLTTSGSHQEEHWHPVSAPSPSTALCHGDIHYLLNKGLTTSGSHQEGHWHPVLAPDWRLPIN